VSGVELRNAAAACALDTLVAVRGRELDDPSNVVERDERWIKEDELAAEELVVMFETNQIARDELSVTGR